MKNIIEIRDLTKHYGELVAVNNISISVSKGDIFAFLGPNGAGKTTTVEICEGIRKPTSGVVRLFGQEFVGRSKSIRERIGVLPQDYRSFERLTVKETLKYYSSFYQRNRDIDDIISLMGLKDKRDELYLNLSGDLKQRVGVAMALVPIIQPPIIKVLTTKEQRKITMGKLRKVRPIEKILFPITVTIIVGIIVPFALPLVGMLMLGNLFQVSGVMDRLSKSGGNELINIATILLGLGIGFLMIGDVFLNQQTLKILLLGVFAFATATAGGTLLGQLFYKLSGGKINPIIGVAGVSAVPMAARVVQKIGLKENPRSHLLMHAMGPNVAGVIGSATAAGVLIGLLG